MTSVSRGTPDGPIALVLLVGLVALGVTGLATNAGLFFLLAYVFLWSASLLFLADPERFVERVESWLELEFSDGGSDRADGPANRTDPEPDPLLTLRERYAAGEVDDDEFERLLGALLSTETLADARRYATRGRARPATEPAIDK
ncbi:SHOCT domain-containing protein [Halegenticoccus soli]|uniref:SHOCT domain-containing protein n=1 Tax=Halegenticoccus soli TaxID=1985678 RepID=UPI000C6CC629|nr:SHOCT domain-containing protein [Halegenticoccus soli]